VIIHESHLLCQGKGGGDGLEAVIVQERTVTASEQTSER